MSEYKPYTQSNDLTFNEYLGKVFSIMAMGLATTSLVAYLFSFLYQNEEMWALVLPIVFISCIGEIVIALVLGRRLERLQSKTAWILFFVYSLLTGISISGIVSYYTAASIWLCFGITTIMFISMALIGYRTNIDLSKYSNLFYVGLIGIIITTIINLLLFRSSLLEWIINYVGVVLFLGLVAYDMQMLRRYYDSRFSNVEMSEKIMIFSAFQLYLDFINLFIRILRLFGRRKD